MKKLLMLCLITGIFVENVHSQDTIQGDPDVKVLGVSEDNTVYDLVAVQVQPLFVGGDKGLCKFLKNNIQYPEVVKENGIQGKVFVAFVVDKDGGVTDVTLYKGFKGGSGCYEEALRIVKMMPKWKPGEQNGKTVKVRYILPILCGEKREIEEYYSCGDMTRGKAITELKEQKDLLDLGIITQEEYNKKKEKLRKYITE